MSDERWRWLLLPAVIADVFLLVYFKYYGTILDQLSSFFSLSYEVMPMPSGISFFMFSLLSYLADVGRGKIEPDPAKPVYLKNVWGKGYIFQPEGRAAD